jgi:Flp pilus assembly pilin Flp
MNALCSTVQPFLRGIKSELCVGDELEQSFVSAAQSEEGNAMVFRSTISSLRSREDGQTMSEYAVVLGVITIAVVTAFAALSGGISTAVNDIVARI